MQRRVIDVENKQSGKLTSSNMLQQRSDFVVNTVLNIIFLLFCITTLYPFLNVVAKSFSTGKEIIGKRVTIFPIMPTLDNYKIIFSDRMLSHALLISIARTVAGTLSTLLVLTMAGYAMSKRDLRGRTGLMVFLLIPMYFGSGLIPSYVNIVRLHLYNSFFVYILPGLFAGFNFLLIMSYITQIPASYEESAMMDGASHPRILASIVFPLCMPIMATIALFCAVGQWNSWFDAMVYVNRYDLQPLQSVLQTIIRDRSMENLIKAAQYNASDVDQMMNRYTPESISTATMVFTMVPILCVYPFLQRYFVTGITLGGIKG